jgi:U3 small nucleolar RNA-associated protein 10
MNELTVLAESLQFLGWPDLARYLSALAGARAHFVGEPAHAASFHASHLGGAGSGGRKDSTYRMRVACVLLAHAAAAPRARLRAALIGLLDGVRSPVKLAMLAPRVTEVLGTEPRVIDDTYGEDASAYMRGLFGAFDGAAGKVMSEGGVKGEEAWTLLQTAAQRCFRSGKPLRATTCVEQYVLTKLQATSRKPAVRSHMHSSVGCTRRSPPRNGSRWSGCCSASPLRTRTRCALSARWSQSSRILTRSQHLSLKGVLAKVREDEPVVIALLAALRPVSVEGAPRASKRAKLDRLALWYADLTVISRPLSAAAVAPHNNDDTIAPLTRLAETLSAGALPASLDLVAALLETLGAVVHAPGIAEGEATYVLQLLMSAVEGAAGPSLVCAFQLTARHTKMLRGGRGLQARRPGLASYGWTSSSSSFAVGDPAMTLVRGSLMRD